MTRPITLLIGWMGSTSKQTSRYAKLYFEHGCDVVTVLPTPLDVLRPLSGRAKMSRLLDLLDDPKHNSRPLIVHAFSTGAYMFGNTLLEAKENNRMESLKKRIVAQVFDSPVDRTQIAEKLPVLYF
jgi:hypothetical protein